MILREIVTFDADFPDDARWDEHGNLTLPEGRAVAESIRIKLREVDIACSDVAQHRFYGWAFLATLENAKVWCLLQRDEGWLLMLDYRKPLMSRLFGSSRAMGFGRLQDRVHATLASDSRYANILWHAKEDYGRGKRDRATHSPR